jgi:hypothetical protein
MIYEHDDYISWEKFDERWKGWDVDMSVFEVFYVALGCWASSC